MDLMNLFLFLAAALLIALSPGPGIFYVAARTLAGGRREGLASSLGTGVGGLVHVGAGALGVSALVMASAEAFTVLKYVGAAYLVHLGVKTWRSAATPLAGTDTVSADGLRALKEGILVEALNPKTAAFFLAFIPQFVELSIGHVALQFAALGLVSVTLNTAVDVVVVFAAAAVRRRLLDRPRLIRRLRQASGCVMGGLGVTLALARRPG
jgi:threonine/homoserine/homoserine lactone efflux protein